jgi:hypothetical protein
MQQSTLCPLSRFMTFDVVALDFRHDYPSQRTENDATPKEHAQIRGITVGCDHRSPIVSNCSLDFQKQKRVENK